MDGLEAVEMKLSELEKGNRIDSEFYKKDFEILEKLIKKHNNSIIGKMAKVTDGEHGSVEFQEYGIKYLTAENIKSGYVEINNIRYIDEATNKRNLRAEVKEGDVLVSIKGTLGEVAVAEKWLLPANMNRDVAIIKIQEKAILSEYLSIFLMSKFGKFQSLRSGSGGVQQMITLERLREFIVPLIKANFQEKIKDLIKTAHENLEQSKLLYSEAENILLEELGLKDWKPTEKNTEIKSLKNSFGLSGRLDAEYYQPKYDEIEEHIRKYKGGYSIIEKACNIKDKNYNPKSGKEYKYIELSNISDSGDINGYTTELGESLPTRARRKVNTGDVIISSIEGSLESCALITKDYDNSLSSNGFYVINSKQINSETLLMIFKSNIMQQILKKIVLELY